MKLFLLAHIFVGFRCGMNTAFVLARVDCIVLIIYTALFDLHS